VKFSPPLKRGDSSRFFSGKSGAVPPFGNIYGKILDVHFIERIRDEVRFTSPELLIAQIDRDIARAREILTL